MSLILPFPARWRAWSGIVLGGLLAGCTSTSRDVTAYREQREAIAQSETSTTRNMSPPTAQVHHDTDVRLAALLGAPRLNRGLLIAAVLERNPGIAAAREGWRAAVARYPQQVGWEDPMVSYRSYPLSLGRSGVAYGQELEISQRIPIGGKLNLQGAIALAEADAAHSDFQAVRIRLAMMTSQVYDDYVLAVRSLAITARQLVLINDLMLSAQAHVANGTTSIQDPLQAEAEAADLLQEQITQAADRDVAVAQLNGLLHRLPIDAPLPLPGEEDPVTSPGDESTALQDAAVRERPDLLAIDAKVHQAEPALTLAQRQYQPDLSVTGSYSSLWDQRDYRYGIGVSVALPVHTDRLQGGIDEAQARIAQARLEREHMERDIRVEVAEAHRRLIAAQALSRVIHDRLLPATHDRAEAARAAYVAGRGSFTDVIAAARAAQTAELRQQQAIADISRRRATLLQTMGRIPTSTPMGPTP